ncbi:hypothetical protein DFH11DRAFT_1828973 [Phellopilus nigrolimitatus]|nr:hypothetical protein DFH11DRAFT_1828973 [Phellopilus nigrolimitatus]
MVSLKLSLSRTGSQTSMAKDDWEEFDRPSSVASTAHNSMSSSGSSLPNADAEDLTINVRQSLENRKGEQRSIDDLRLLAISTNMTELSYSISDIQTRIFEIQELRHQSQSSQDPQNSSTGVIDQALMNLDERLEAVNRGMKTVADALEPLSSRTPKQLEDEEDERALLLRKHSALLSDWESVQDESEVLREELKEDKWLTVFRTVSEQADGMMSSLEKAVQRCQLVRLLMLELKDFIWRVHRRVPSEDATLLARPSSSSRDGSNAPLTYETYCSLQESFEAKKKHYMPATSKVLSIIDKGVQDRVTKNGECLRRHAESTQRWRNLRERMQRTDDDYGDYSEAASGTARRNGHLATPPSSEGPRRIGSSLESLSNSMSPFRKLARRIGKVSGRATPTSKHAAKMPSSDPIPTTRHRTSMFPLRGTTDSTPVRPMHKHTQSLTPESPSMRRAEERRAEEIGEQTLKCKPKWNASTKVEPKESSRAVGRSLSRHSSVANLRMSTNTGTPAPPLPLRSQSRSSFASSRPWSPMTTSFASTTRSSISRPPSRAQSPFGSSPHARPKTPSHIPTPVFWRSTSASSEASYDDKSPPESSIMQRLSPSHSTSSGVSAYTRAKTPLGSHNPYARPPSRSMIPVPKFQILFCVTIFLGYVRLRPPRYIDVLPFLCLPCPNTRTTPPSGRRASRLPPSSFREASAAPSLPRTPSSRPSSRSGAYTPSLDAYPMHQYVPGNPKDPLDAQVAAVANALPHGLMIERVDPPLRVIPKENEEIKAQYAFSSHLSRKLVTCRLLTMSRSGVKTKKVMCRVGGGWQDLQLYLLNRQAGL